MSRSFHYTFDDAVQKSNLRAPIRHLLMVIATKTNKDGHIPDQFQPSVTELARRTGMTRRTVLRVIVEAEEAGWLLVTRPTKRAAREEHESNRYVLQIPDGLVTESHQPSDAQPLGLVSESHTYPDPFHTFHAVAQRRQPSADGASALPWDFR